MRHLRAAAIVTAMTAAACSGGGHSLARPPRPPVTVLPSADRIRLGQPRLGGSPPCVDDEYCAAGLGRVYGIDLGNRVVALSSPNATVGALTGGAIDIAALPSSAAELSDPRVTQLIDDRSLQPANNIVPVVAGAAVTAVGPALGSALDAVSTALDPAGLATLEQGLAVGGAPGDVAGRWLDSHPVQVPGPNATAPPVVFGARADPDARTLAAVYSGALQRAGWTATVTPLEGDRADELDAFAGGRINVAIEEMTALLEHLTGFAGVATADQARTAALLTARLADDGLVAMEPARAARETAFVVSRSVATTLSISTLSDLARATGARPPVASPGTPEAPGRGSGDLGIGSTGPTVVALQQRLAQLGYPVVAADGFFDEATRRAVVSFQLDHGVIADGAVGAPTTRALATATSVPHPAGPPAPGDPNSLRLGANPPGAGPAGTVYLVFAGGPTPATSQILDVLRAHSSSATFFVADAAALRHPDVVRAARDRGEAVGVAMDPHDTDLPVAADVMLRTGARTQDDLAGILQRTPGCLLAPYGATDPDGRSRATARGWSVVLWDIDPQDWRRPGAEVIASDVVNNARPGSVVLLHDGGGDRNQTVEALGPILDGLARRGFTASAIPECEPRP